MLVYTVNKNGNKTLVYNVNHGIKGDKGDTGATGPQGIQGIPGDAATIQIGSVTSGDAPSVVNSGNEHNAIFDFTLVKGDTGETGAQGDAAGFGTPRASITTIAAGAEPTVSVITEGPNTAKVFDFRFGMPDNMITVVDSLNSSSTSSALSANQGRVLKETIDNIEVSKDWNENDSEAGDYIQNRTHYTETGVSTYFNGTTSLESLDPTASAFTPSSIPTNETQLTIVIDGVSYQETVSEATDTDLTIHIEATDEIYDVIWTLNPETSELLGFLCVYSEDDSGEVHTHSLNIYSGGETVHQLDKKYIPQASAIAQGDTGFVTGGQVYDYLGSNIDWCLMDCKLSDDGTFTANLFKGGSIIEDGYNFYYRVRKLVSDELDTYDEEGTVEYSDDHNVEISISSVDDYERIEVVLYEDEEHTKLIGQWETLVKAASIAEGETGYTTGDQVYEALQTAGNDVWEITKVSVNGRYSAWSFSTLTINFVVYKNGVQYDGDLWYKLPYNNPYQGTPTVTGSCTKFSPTYGPYSGDVEYTINLDSGYVESTLYNIQLYTDSSFTQFIGSETVTFTPKSYSVQSGDSGFITSGGVYDYVSAQIGDITTILQSL